MERLCLISWRCVSAASSCSFQMLSARAGHGVLLCAAVKRPLEAVHPGGLQQPHHAECGTPECGRCCLRVHEQGTHSALPFKPQGLYQHFKRVPCSALCMPAVCVQPLCSHQLTPPCMLSRVLLGAHLGSPGGVSPCGGSPAGRHRQLKRAHGRTQLTSMCCLPWPYAGYGC